VKAIFISVLVAACLAACSKAPRYIAPEERPVPSSARLDTLIGQLASLHGEFTEPGMVYGLISDYRGIGEIVSADTLAIHKLVACLGDKRRSHVTLSGERVPVGMLCAETLLDTKYVRTGLQYGRFPNDWPGLVEPTTDVARLARAQSAWLDWFSRHPLVWGQ
jgi:hypothetical protein